MEIIDFHVQAFPHSPSALIPEKGRVWAKLAAQPISHTFHETYPYLRFLPELGRKVLEGVADRVLPMPFLLLESSADDLREAMAHSNVGQAVVVADPTRIPNEFVLDLAARFPQFIPCIQILRSEPDPGGALRRFKDQGARVLKISDALQFSHEPPRFFEDLAAEANVLKIPVILRLSDRSRLHRILPLLTETVVILAHMNQNDSESAFEIAENFPQIHLETSWQPIEVIAEAVRRVGAERVLFGSDWPYLGNNIAVALRRVQDTALAQMISEREAALILGGNARRILESGK